MARHTYLPTSLWTWEPFTALPDHARILWLALYTSGTAKRLPPGLWEGSIAVMAETSHQDPDAVRDALDVMLQAGVVEFDQPKRLARLTDLPSTDERPMSANHVKGWWNSFKSLRECPLRNAHIPLLRWLADSVKPELRLKIDEVWAQTFANLPIPALRHRGVRRLPNSFDTSTPTQPSLFPKADDVDPLPPDQKLDQSGLIHRNVVAQTENQGFGGGFDTPRDRDRDRDRDLLLGGGSGGGGAARPHLTLVPLELETMGLPQSATAGDEGPVRSLSEFFATGDGGDVLQRFMTGKTPAKESP